MEVRDRICNRRFDSALDVVKWDVVPVAYRQDVRVEFLSVGSSDPQGVFLGVFAASGSVSAGGASAKSLILDSRLGPVVSAHVESEDGLLSVYNGRWRTLASGRESWVSQGDFFGMRVEEYGGRRIYRCNNGRRDDPFDKLVFSLELLPGSS